LKRFPLTLIGIMVIVLSSIIIPYAKADMTPSFETQWGSYGLQTTGQFAFPQGIAVDSSGHVYVTDLGNRRIEKFDASGNFLDTWGTKGSGNGQFQAPAGIAVYNGSVYVVDNEQNRVQEFDTSGSFITQWGSQGSGDGQFLMPQGIGVDPTGNVYVADPGNSRIEKFSSTGKFLMSIGQSGLNDGSFLSPRAVTADSQGSIYVSDSGNDRIEKFTRDGVFLQSFSASSGVDLKTPLGVAVDSSGDIFITDTGNNRMVEIDKNGNQIASWGSQGKDAGNFDDPRDVAVDATGNIYVVDSNNNRIQEFVTQVPSSTPNTQQTQTSNNNQTTQNTSAIQNTTNSLITDPNDKTPPSITAPNDMTIEATGILTPVSIGQATATDDTKVISITNNGPSKFPLGTTMVTWTAMDAGGNVAQAVQKITIVDTTPPTLTAPPNVTFEATSADHNVVNLGLPSAYDAVGVESITNDAPPYFSIGQTVVTWKAFDQSGNVATAKQTITVQDTKPPTIHAPPDITQEATSAADNIVNLGNATVTDIEQVIITNNAPKVFPLGTTTVTWTATDTSGNTASASQIIKIVDTTPPKISPPPNVIFEATSLTDNQVPLGNATVTDNGIIQSVTNNATKTFPLGKTVVLWTAKDTSGNISNATQIVDVVDTTPPKLIPPKDVKVEATSLDSNLVSLGNATATDIESVTITNNATKTFPLGKTAVLWTAKDAAGNVANATQTVDVVDTTPPVIIAPKDIVVNATSSTDNHVEIGNATATDAVKVASITNDSPPVFPFGQTIVTWKATDEAGNTAIATQKISVVDRTPPQLIIPANIITNATAFQTPIQIGQGTTTGIIDPSPKITNNATAAFPLGTTVIEWNATDKFGNSKILTQTITILACGKPVSSYNLIMGTSGDDNLVGKSDVPNLIIGLEGNDIIHAGNAGDCIIAGNGDNIIFGGSGEDTIIAGNGDNIIKGGSGNEEITVGGGSNIIVGGNGHNTCKVGNSSHDTIVNCVEH